MASTMLLLALTSDNREEHLHQDQRQLAIVVLHVVQLRRQHAVRRRGVVPRRGRTRRGRGARPYRAGAHEEVDRRP